MRSTARDSVALSTVRPCRSRQLGLLTLAMTALVVMMCPTPASALPAGKHTESQAVIVDTPRFLGYDKAKKGYHLRVSGRWNDRACDKKYCWPATQGDIGSDDAVFMNFGGTDVYIQELSVTWFDACGNQTYSHHLPGKNIKFGEDAAAAVDDKVYVDKRITSEGSGLGPIKRTSEGRCGNDSMPTANVGNPYSGLGGAASSSRQWFNLKGASFAFHVWVRPASDTPGKCPQLNVKGGYTHTWSVTKLKLGVGASFPFSVGVDVSPEGDTKAWTELSQYGKALITPKLCETGMPPDIPPGTSVHDVVGE